MSFSKVDPVTDADDRGSDLFNAMQTIPIRTRDGLGAAKGPISAKEGGRILTLSEYNAAGYTLNAFTNLHKSANPRVNTGNTPATAKAGTITIVLNLQTSPKQPV